MVDSPDRSEALRSIMSGIQGSFKIIGQELARDPVDRGLHSTEILKETVTDNFGTFTKKWEYVDGCELGNQLVHGPVGEIVIVTVDSDGNKMAFVMGRTPDAYSTSRGGMVIPKAGNEGDFLCVVQKIQDGKLIGPQSFQYLDTEDLTQNVLRKNSTSPIIFKKRQIQMVGQVERVYGLLEK